MLVARQRILCIEIFSRNIEILLADPSIVISIFYHFQHSPGFHISCDYFILHFFPVLLKCSSNVAYLGMTLKMHTAVEIRPRIMRLPFVTTTTTAHLSTCQLSPWPFNTALGSLGGRVSLLTMGNSLALANPQ